MLCFLWADPKELCLCSKSEVRIVCTAASYSNNSENIFSYISRKIFLSAAWKQQLKYIRTLPSLSFSRLCQWWSVHWNRSKGSFSSFSLEIWQGQAVLLSIRVILCFTTGRRYLYIQITSSSVSTRECHVFVFFL